MKKIIIIQARMSSSRLPGKVLMDICGKPMLFHQITRLKNCDLVDDIVIATTSNELDDEIIRTAKMTDVRWYRGSEHDVLSRYIEAAEESKADIIIRSTADCPLIDPSITDKVIELLLKNINSYDYTSNIIRRTYPRGLDVEAFFIDTLSRINRLAKEQSDREHVTSILRSNFASKFLIGSIEDSINNSDLRWTVDTSEDLSLVRNLYSKLDLTNKIINYQEVINFVRANPSLIKINSGIETWDPQKG